MRIGNSSRFAVAITTCTVRFLSTFLEDLQSIPADVVNNVARQLDIRNLLPAHGLHRTRAEHLSKLTGQTTVVKEQITTSGRGWSTNVSRSTHEVSRPLLTPDEAMRMKGARKNAQGMITEAGNMIVYVAGYPATMGLQPLYFKDPELARRARLAAEPAQAKKSPTLANASV